MRSPPKVILALLAVFCIATIVVAPASASFAQAIPYLTFNGASQEWQYWDLDRTYGSVALTARVRDYNVWNSTGSDQGNAWFKVAFMNSSTDATREGVSLMFHNASHTLDVWYIYGTLGDDDVKIGTGTYIDNGNTTVQISGGFLTVWTENPAGTYVKLVNAFAYTGTVAVVGAYSSGADILESGYIQVQSGTGGVSSGVNSAISTALSPELIGLIVTVAVVSMVLGLLKKLGKV